MHSSRRRRPDPVQIAGVFQNAAIAGHQVGGQHAHRLVEREVPQGWIE